jgi:hypothetical protein
MTRGRAPQAGQGPEDATELRPSPGGPPPRTGLICHGTGGRLAGMLLKAKTWLIKTLPFLARWGQNTTPNP